VLTVSRHPTRFKDQHSFVQRGEAALSDWEVELAEKAREWPIEDLAGLAEEAKVGDGAKGEAGRKDEDVQKTEKMKVLGRKYAPWTIELKILEIRVNDKPLTAAEKRMVVRASRFPMQFNKYGEYKVARGRALSEWEKELVKQARKWPLEGEVLEGFVIEEWGVREREKEEMDEPLDGDGGEEEEGLDYSDGSGGKEVQDEDEEEEDTQMNEAAESEKAAATSVNSDPEPASKPDSKTTDPTTKPAAQTPTHRPIHPLPSKPYRPALPVPAPSHRPSLIIHIFTLKSLIQSNVRALFVAKYPSGSYSDTVTSTSSTMPPHHRVTLLVHPARSARSSSTVKFVVLHSTDFHARIEDAFGELKAWTEGEVRDVLREHGVWTRTDSAASSALSVPGNNEEKDVETAGLKRQPDASGKLKRKADGEEDGGEKRKRVRIDGDDRESVEEGGSEELKDLMGEEDARAYEAVFGSEIPVHEEQSAKHDGSLNLK
jgi:hypothetical protein